MINDNHLNQNQMLHVTHKKDFFSVTRDFVDESKAHEIVQTMMARNFVGADIVDHSKPKAERVTNIVANADWLSPDERQQCLAGLKDSVSQMNDNFQLNLMYVRKGRVNTIEFRRKLQNQNENQNNTSCNLI